MSGAVLGPGCGAARMPRAARMRPRGLPHRLPAGEKLLWQGEPDTRTLMVRAFHIRVLTAYFGLILVWSGLSAAGTGASRHAIAICVLHRATLALVPLLLIALYAWAIQRSTVYSITTRRVVISFGIALPVTFNIPFSRIEAAGLRLYPDNSGDIPLRLLPDEKMSYLVMWPHARPWRMARTEPMLRCIAGAGEASGILTEALAEAVAEELALAGPSNLPHSAMHVSEPALAAGFRSAQEAAA